MEKDFNATRTAKRKHRHVLVVGAGPVGALAAIFLRRQGYAVSVYESGRTPGRQMAGAVAPLIWRWPTEVLRPSPVRVMDRVRPLLIPMRGRMAHPLAGESAFQPYGRSDDEVIYSVSRHALNVALIDALTQTTQADDDAAPALTLRFDAPCAAVDLQRGEAEFVSDSPERVAFDHIIGADGAGSVVRQAIQDYALQVSEAQQTGEAQEAAHQDPAAASEPPFVNMAPLGHGYKELTIPPTAEGQPALAMDALHIWPRGNHMMIALPNQDFSFTVTLFLPLTGEHSFEALEDTAYRAQFLQQYYAHALQWMPQWSDEFAQNPVGQLGTLYCAPWHIADRALLIGDAAHAIVPFHGQGMNCGFEDCVVLDACLQGVGDSDDWATVLPTFVAERQPNAAAIAQMAIENYEEMRASVVDPVFLLKKAVGLELQRRFPGQFTPRYSMVMFGQLPYAQALAIGQQNDAILTRLVAGKAQIDEIDWALAARLLAQNAPAAQSEGALSH